MSAAPTPSTTKRTTCPRCRRPPVTCYCASLPPVPVRTRATRIVVLQHPREHRQRQALSSVPVMAHVLDADCLRVVPVDIDAATTTATLSAALEPWVSTADALLVLFPDPSASRLSTEWLEAATCDRVDDGLEPAAHHDVDVEALVRPLPRRVLVVIDGTWTEAKKIVHHTRSFWSAMAESQRTSGRVFSFVCLDSETPTPRAVSEPTTSGSIYGELRKEPMTGCVSTLEAVAGALVHLEPHEHGRMLHETLCVAFAAMVAAQEAFHRRGRAKQEARHGNTPKPTGSAIVSAGLSTRPPPPAPSTLGVARAYAFFTTHKDFRHRQVLVQEGEVRVCTRDEALAHCQELNQHRKRGNRVSTLPLEAFERQQRPQQQEENDNGDPAVVRPSGGEAQS